MWTGDSFWRRQTLKMDTHLQMRLAGVGFQWDPRAIIMSESYSKQTIAWFYLRLSWLDQGLTQKSVAD